MTARPERAGEADRDQDPVPEVDMIPSRNSHLIIGVVLALLCVTLVSTGMDIHGSPGAATLVGLGTIVGMAAGWFFGLGWRG